MPCWACRESPGGESLLMKPAEQVFFVRQRRAPRVEFTHFAKQSYVNTKSNQKKGDPQSGPLRGSLKKLKEPENLEASLLRSRRTSRFFNPSPPAFSSPARTGLGRNAGTNFPESELIPQPVLAGLRSAGGSGNKFLDVRRRQSRLVSKNSADFEHRRLPEAKRRDPDCGSPFLCLLSFGEAKESELPPGNPRQTNPIKVNRY
jgi:hypothetical protein